MPRGLRLDAPGTMHHVIVRGIERGHIFRSDRDREDFLARLGHVAEEGLATCFAWVLIPNHVHILLRIEESGSGLDMGQNPVRILCMVAGGRR